jgi:outer membrane protein TolC
LIRHNLKDPIFSGQLAYLFNGTRHGPTVNQGVATLGVSQVLPTGGTVTVSGNAGVTQQSSGLPGNQLNAGGSVSVSQPLLRGVAPYAFEPLTQSERDVVYALRDFELFRQSFAIEVVSRYYGLVQQKQRVASTKRSADALEWIARRAQAFFNVGRDQVNKIEKLRADQAYLRAKNGVIDETQGLKLALDRYKVFLGISVASEFDVPENALPGFVPVTLDLDSAVKAALESRLDIRSARDRVEDAERQLSVSENHLLPDLLLTGGYGIQNDPPPLSRGAELGFRNDNYFAGVTLNLPLERTAERNNYRAALIKVDQARRALRDAEDNLIVDVRDSLRTLRQKEESIKIQKEIIDTENARAKYSEIQYQAGEIGTRDRTEARESLLSAENDHYQAIVSYEVQRLTLLRQIGKLVVDEEGNIVP